CEGATNEHGHRPGRRRSGEASGGRHIRPPWVGPSAGLAACFAPYAPWINHRIPRESPGGPPEGGTGNTRLCSSCEGVPTFRGDICTEECADIDPEPLRVRRPQA